MAQEKVEVGPIPSYESVWWWVNAISTGQGGATDAFPQWHANNCY